MKSKNIIFMMALFGLVACGKDGGGSGSGGGSVTQAAAREMVEAAPGSYYAILRPVNIYSNGFIPYGSAMFTLQGDQLSVSTSMDDDQAVPHRQTLHIGTRCPTQADDSNGDGFVDYEEAMKVVGSALMPLDDDLNSQLGGKDLYPRGRAMTYKKVVSLSKVNADLWKADEDPSDNVMKLSNGQGIGFEGRVVLAHGTAPQSSFPTSLAAHPGEQPHISLPVVCGVLKKIN
ncbi:hypothetical protein [Peredibacter starrii]|uniref:EF-hand domain-containing protein n=1 Tax=Peredibacter starrii TaxID=28202 RepID=A0AAX4HTQ1_9BACT|nr:hypothetical protein [Peredibacter starrii]WPU66575.1 hypothetical protein SOO65_07440 [Peredibacter starrii]